MRFEIRDRGFKVAEGLRGYVGLRLMSELDHHVRHVDSVTVCLSDVDAPEGGIERRCRMVVLLASSGEVAAEETDAGLYAAIDRTAERLAIGVALALARRSVASAPIRQLRGGAAERARTRRCEDIRRANQPMEAI